MAGRNKSNRKREPKPEISDWLKMVLRREEYSLGLRSYIGSNCNYINDRHVANQIITDVVFNVDDDAGWYLLEEDETELTPDEEFLEKEDHVIGYIKAWKVRGYIEKKELMFWSDEISTDTNEAFSWYYATKLIDVDDYPRVIIYVSSVWIQPRFRGYDIALKALTTLLDTFECDFVMFKPHPINTGGKSTKAEIKALQRYWRRAGVTNYDARKNIMWQSEWSCPEAFAPQLYESTWDD